MQGTVSRRGRRCIATRACRVERCQHTHTALRATVSARQSPGEAGPAEPILLRNGFDTEASSPNACVAKNGGVPPPPRDHLILMGITYDLLVALAGEGRIALQIRPVAEAELRGADEIWLSSSTKEVLAVTTLDGKPVGSGKPGPLFRRMHALYQEHKGKLRAARRVVA